MRKVHSQSCPFKPFIQIVNEGTLFDKSSISLSRKQHNTLILVHNYSITLNVLYKCLNGYQSEQHYLKQILLLLMFIELNEEVNRC